MNIPLLPGLADFSEAYDGFILDIWGVVHQGGAAYDEAVDCVRQLRAASKRVIFLSNAPRRAEKVAAILESKGIARTLYDGVLSSGEAARIAFESGDAAALGKLGKRYFLLAAPDDDDLLRGLDYTSSATVAEADFLLAIGLSDERSSLAAHEPFLSEAASRGLTMLCVNPDREVIRLGTRELCAGALAARYEQMGGAVTYVGKPYPFIYRLSLDMLGIAQQSRVLAVGDGLETDISGARAAGLDSLLVTGGLLAEELGVSRLEAPDPATLNAICRKANERPRAAIPTLRW
ncbi:MAG: TIGR01459 family HAD-type hydrolase [Proteobacteria bacterium]|nr:TIGR01459 family HAD-type hydrolase [Pseudomonadota bacterium]MDA1355387.1 TIGR01459 family HAD-type hydrolase [Pseudomonadota bacterium]